MSCQHLKKLFELCEQEEIRIAAPDLVRFVCPRCNDQETCPSILMDEYDALHGAARSSVTVDTRDGESEATG